jgi:stage II sporulation protein D
METFGKACREAARTSATVTRVGRFAVVLGALVMLVCGGLASALLAAGAAPGGTTSTGTTSVADTTTTTVTATAAVSTASAVLAFSGHGWGHGLGMSQWGAYGYAKHGWTYDRILAHYYTGTTLGTARVATVRVLVASGRKVKLSSSVPWTVTDATGVKTQLDPGAFTLGAKLALAAAPAAQSPLVFTSTQPLSVAGRAYRGRLVVSTDGKTISVVNVVGLEAYLKGVVPAEMPSAWPAEALKAQAVAARSYALANLQKGRAFDLYGDTRDQAYGGVAAEWPSASSAVDATKGQVVTYAGKVADTLFFSTSGGRTASALESTGKAVPYLVPVADPYDTFSPYHDWGPVLFDATKVAKQLKLPGRIVGVQATDGASGRVKTMTLTTDDEAGVALSGNAVRSDLDLRSTWFAPAFLQLLPVARTMTYGGAASLTGLLRGADGVTLESRQGGGDWAPAGDLAPSADGSFSMIVRPSVTTWYRLAWGVARAGLAKISVAARVSATAAAGAVQGTVRPVSPGAPVQLQEQQTDGSWRTLSSTTADSASAWAFAGSLAAGTYRVRSAPGHGIVAGLSAPFAVQ